MIQSPSPSVKIQIIGGKVFLGFNIAGRCQQTFIPKANFPAQNLNFHSRLRWWDQIQAIFLNLFYFNSFIGSNIKLRILIFPTKFAVLFDLINLDFCFRIKIDSLKIKKNSFSWVKIRSFWIGCLIWWTSYRKVASSRLSRLVAHLRIFKLFMKGKIDLPKEFKIE